MISVIIPCLHSPMLGHTLQSLKVQDARPGDMEVIVVGMDKYGFAAKNDWIRFIETPGPVCAAAARNIGIQNAMGEILAFVDADCIVSPDWLSALKECYNDPDVEAVSGGVSFPDVGYWTLCDNISTFYNYHFTSPKGSRPYAPTLNFSVRRDVVDSVGLFDESFPGAAGEDIDWTLRIHLSGHRIHFEPQVLVYHHPIRNSFSDVIGRSFRFGGKMIKVFWRHRSRRKLSILHRHPLLLVSFAPIIAAMITWKIFLVNRGLRKYWHTWPVIFLAKVAWRMGGAYQLCKDKRRSNLVGGAETIA